MSEKNPVAEDTTIFLVQPQAILASAVKAEIVRLETIVAQGDASPSGLGRLLLELSDITPPGNYYVGASALHDIFLRRGILDDYYDPENSRRSSYRETNKGWELLLRQPDGKPGIFALDYQVNGNRQVVHYLPRGKK